MPDQQTTPTWHFHLNYNLVYLVIIAILAVSAWNWLHEHDLRVRAEEQEKASEAIIKKNEADRKQLEQDKADVVQQRDKAVADLQRRRAAIKTPEQAVAAMPELTGLPSSNFRVTPLGNVEVSAPAAVTIAQQLEDGKICVIQLKAANDLYGKEQQINATLVSDNTELKKEKESWKKASGKRGFWGNVWQGTKYVGLAAVSGLIGYGIHH